MSGTDGDIQIERIEARIAEVELALELFGRLKSTVDIKVRLMARLDALEKQLEEHTAEDRAEAGR